MRQVISGRMNVVIQKLSAAARTES